MSKLTTKIVAWRWKDSFLGGPPFALNEVLHAFLKKEIDNYEKGETNIAVDVLGEAKKVSFPLTAKKN